MKNAWNADMSATDARVGRWLVSSESCSTWSGDVMKLRNFHAASTRACPLSKITQLSGPAIVWWLPPGSNDGMTWTP